MPNINRTSTPNLGPSSYTNSTISRHERTVLILKKYRSHVRFLAFACFVYGIAIVLYASIDWEHLKDENVPMSLRVGVGLAGITLFVFSVLFLRHSRAISLLLRNHTLREPDKSFVAWHMLWGCAAFLSVFALVILAMIVVLLVFAEAGGGRLPLFPGAGP